VDKGLSVGQWGRLRGRTEVDRGFSFAVGNCLLSIVVHLLSES